MGRHVRRRSWQGLVKAAVASCVALALVPPGDDPDLIPLVVAVVLAGLALTGLALALLRRPQG
ncbi:hypothetical protein [Jannaschia seohaensis]|uniref:MYXO-CTERM domain-containing protein n=1 Tax=Jannaschia seohaensis TaxID=475081 RepID=A0A2Y9AV89_9RHOB|nr:hypothetical protein [Jannaschia seohaensis]PWJ16972.1 hypothetical protein BCF38_10785 [Jannaschia seohaensis]SSA48251.1 hypothetical protein SAMN05421539_10785 [Jannaschia seohaensis]